MSSGTNVEVNATSMTPSAPVGGADALAPLTSALDNLHTTLTSIETTLKGLDLGGAIRVALSNEFSAFTSSFKNAITSFETILLRFTNNFTERLDNLLSNIKVTATKGIPERGEIGEAFTVTLSNELSAFVSRFDTVLTQFTTKFTTNLDKLLSNISVTAKGGRGGKKESRKDKEFRIELESNLKLSEKNIRDAQKQLSVEIEANLKEAAKEIKTRRKNFIVKHLDYGLKADKVAGSFLDNFKKSMEASKKAMAIPSPYNRDYLKNLNRPKDDKNYVTVTPTGEWSGTPAKDPNKLTSIPSPYSTFFRRGMSSDKEWKNFVTPTGSYSGNFAGDPKKVMAIPSPYSRDYLRNADKERKNPITPSFGVQPPKGPMGPKGLPSGSGGFDWKKLGTAAGLGFAFTGGAGIAAAAIVKLLPKMAKAFEPVVDLGNALVDSLDPLAETVNTALTPFRELANQLKRFSVLGGFGASFNMNRINAQFESSLNDLMGNMLDTISSIFSNPLAGIMNAASMIGKFVDMVDPAAMSLFQQTMRDTFAVIGTALRPAMIELTKMLRSFADHLHPVLQGAMPRIMSGLQALAEAFERNMPLITLMIERFVGDLTKQVDKSGTLFGEELKPENVLKGLFEFNKSSKENKSAKEKTVLDRFIEGLSMADTVAGGKESAQATITSFEKTLLRVLMVAGKEGGIEKNRAFLTSFLKSIVDKEKLKSTVGLARVTDASYGGVAEVGREAVRRAFEGSRLQDLTRKNNREDIEQGTYAAFKKALDEFKSGEKIYGGPPPEGIHSGTQFYPKPVR